MFVVVVHASDEYLRHWRFFIGWCLFDCRQSTFLDVLQRYQITYADIPPIYLVAYQPDQFPKTLTRMLIGGEIKPIERIKIHCQSRKILLVYGPTEATICTSMILYETTCKSMTQPIGSPLTGTHIKLSIKNCGLEENMWPLVIGTDPI